MKIGLYFGSFNPVHVGHLIIASHIADNTDIQQVWFIVSPQNPLKKSISLLNAYHRLHLVQLAIEDDIRLKASNVEFNLPKPSYTIDTLAYLREKYPQHEFFVILGSDSFSNLQKWKNYEQLISENTFIVYPRPGFPISEKITTNTIVVKAPFLEISSTMIREIIKAKKSIRYLVPEKVREEIEENNYYKG
jgi:nicotinate-nucleotide adenylyltransferase